MICITGQNTGNGGDPKPFANACHRRCTPPKTSWKIRSNKRTWQQCKNDSFHWMNGAVSGKNTQQSFFRPMPCIRKESGVNMSQWGRSQRIRQVFSKRSDHSGYWWEHPKFWFQHSSWSEFSPPENGWVLGGTVFCRSKVLWNPPTTLNPKLLQHWHRVLKIFRWW